MLCLFLCLLLVHTSSSLSVECNYVYYPHNHIASMIYCCEVRYDLYITSQGETRINDASGSHQYSKNDDDVTGFWAVIKEIEYFPSGLEKIFKNLKLIDIYGGRIKEIHQSDLKPFPDLTYLVIMENDIKFLEAGLFDYNPKLEVIGLSQNKITKVHPDVFDHLPYLTTLWLKSNDCIGSDATKSRSAVKEMIEKIKVKCSNTILTTTSKNYDYIEDSEEQQDDFLMNSNNFDSSNVFNFYNSTYGKNAGTNMNVWFLEIIIAVVFNTMM